MTYVEWYEAKYDDKWTINHAPSQSLVMEYEDYCEEHDTKPVWNG